MATSFLDLVAQRVVVYDGATGTWLQTQDLTLDDYGGEALEGCTDYLGITRPDVIAARCTRLLRGRRGRRRDQHVRRVRRPARRVRHGRALPRDRELANARIAREVADGFSTPDRPRLRGRLDRSRHQVPQPRPDPLRRAARPLRGAGRGLLEGGVDLFILETQFDLLAMKAGHERLPRAMAKVGREVPIQVQVTMELTGRMLSAPRSVPRSPPSIRCDRRHRHQLRHRPDRDERAPPPPLAAQPACRSRCCRTPACPRSSTARCTTTSPPRSSEAHQRRFVEELGVQVVGGCCGTTPEYIRRLADAVAPNLDPAHRAHPRSSRRSRRSTRPCASQQDLSFLIIGERTNANGSKKFRDAMLDAGLGHLHRDGHRADPRRRPRARRLRRLRGPRRHRRHGRDRQRFATQANAPLVLDSTEPEVWRPACSWIGGRAILNSANLEDGDGPAPASDRMFRSPRSTAPRSSAC
jgi:5-methyltetrahydrofolate--homocysteine methyltransferase